MNGLTFAGTVAAALIIALGLVLFWPREAFAADCGEASWYGAQHHGRLMANGQPFDMHAMTAAMWDVPFGTRVRVTRQDTGASVVVTITDRGPARRLNRVIDLSRAAAAELGMIDRGIAPVCITPL